LATSSFPSYVLNTPAYEATKLGNGVRVASEATGGELASVTVTVDAGSRYESPSKNGTAHFVEHLAFKGTTNLSQQQLSKEIANLGGQFSATTTRDSTAFTATVFKKDLAKAVQILGDIVQNSTFDAAAVEAEKAVILGELSTEAKTHAAVVFNNLHDTAFQGTGLAQTVYGTKASISSITSADLASFVKTYYTGPRVVVSAAGAVQQAEVAALADKYFGSLPSAPPAGFAPKTDVAAFIGSDIRVREDTINHAHVAVAVQTGGFTDPHYFPLLVLQNILGSYSGKSPFGTNVFSGLGRRLAEEHLAIKAEAFTLTYKDTGLFGVHVITEPTKAQLTLYWVMYELARLGNNVSAEEVAKAKAALKTAYLAKLDTAPAVSADIGKQILGFGRKIAPVEVFARIDAVDAATVKQTGLEFIDDQELAVSSLGNVYEVPDYNWLRRRTFWLRA